MTSAEADSMLDRWLAEEAAVIARHTAGAAAQPLSRAELAALDGLAQLRTMIEGRGPQVSIGRTLDFLLVEVEFGQAVFQGRPGPGHLNPMGVVHGGWFATLLDSALGCAVHASMPVGKAYTTLELKVNMIRALTPQVARVRAEGRVIHVGGQTATAEARLVGPDGKLYAHGTTTCLVFTPRAP